MTMSICIGVINKTHETIGSSVPLHCISKAFPPLPEALTSVARLYQPDFAGNGYDSCADGELGFAG